VIVRATTVILTSALVCACFPYHYTERPGVNGLVLDSDSGAPIPNTSIEIESRKIDKSTQQTQVTAKTDGSFNLQAKQFWGVYIIPMDVFGPWSDAIIAAPGYETVTIKLAASAIGPSRFSLGTIKLKKQNGT